MGSSIESTSVKSSELLACLPLWALKIHTEGSFKFKALKCYCHYCLKYNLKITCLFSWNNYDVFCLFEWIYPSESCSNFLIMITFLTSLTACVFNVFRYKVFFDYSKVVIGVFPCFFLVLCTSLLWRLWIIIIHWCYSLA